MNLFFKIIKQHFSMFHKSSVHYELMEYLTDGVSYGKMAADPVCRCSWECQAQADVYKCRFVRNPRRNKYHFGSAK